MSWNLLEATVLSLVLALDASAASAALAASGDSVRAIGSTAILFGLAQALMAGIGAWGGGWVAMLATDWSHWIAFALLVVVGGGMLVSDQAPSRSESETPLRSRIGIALATSIDALVAGVTLPLLDLPIGLSVAVIGLGTMLLAGLAGWLGTMARTMVGPWGMRAAGGVLIALGLRILIEHFV